MIQYDVFNGEKTLIKESRKKRLIKLAQNVAKIPEQEPEEQKVNFTIEKKVLLKPHQVVTVTTFHRNFTQSDNSRENLEKGKKGQYNGYMSDNTSRYVKRVVENWLTGVELCNDESKDYRERPYITFLTLTLPSKQVHHDKVIKEKCLDPMVKWLKDSIAKTGRFGGNIDAYLWRAESQKNGNLHFHIICDKWIDHERIQRQWNQICERLGYMTAYKNTQEYIYRNGFRMRAEQAIKQKNSLMYVVQNAIKDRKLIPDTHYVDNPKVRQTLNTIIADYRETPKSGKKDVVNYGLSDEIAEMLVYQLQKTAYEKGVKSNWTKPNSIDIHKLNNVVSISAYITKYVSKKDIIPPKLAKNEVLVNHKILGQRIVKVIEGGDVNNILDWEDDGIQYVPKFESRKVHGRIWGKSDNLSDVKDDSGKIRKIEAPNFTTEIKHILNDSEFGYRSFLQVENTDVLEYVEKVTATVPEAETKRVAELIKSDYCEVIPLGEYSTRINYKTKRKEKYFKIHKQVNYLDKLSPIVKIRYLEHYQSIYRTIYQHTA
jgi:hypothetical protein